MRLDATNRDVLNPTHNPWVAGSSPARPTRTAKAQFRAQVRTHADSGASWPLLADVVDRRVLGLLNRTALVQESIRRLLTMK
jgi:hypothetical protein